MATSPNVRGPPGALEREAPGGPAVGGGGRRLARLRRRGPRLLPQGRVSARAERRGIPAGARGTAPRAVARRGRGRGPPGRGSPCRRARGSGGGRRRRRDATRLPQGSGGGGREGRGALRNFCRRCRRALLAALPRAAVRPAEAGPPARVSRASVGCRGASRRESPPRPGPGTCGAARPRRAPPSGRRGPHGRPRRSGTGEVKPGPAAERVAGRRLHGQRRTAAR